MEIGKWLVNRFALSSSLKDSKSMIIISDSKPKQEGKGKGKTVNITIDYLSDSIASWIDLWIMIQYKW